MKKLVCATLAGLYLVSGLTGYSRGTVRSKFRFGGTSRHRVISRSQLARQIADLAMYQPE